MDSNHRRRKPAELQSAPFGHSGNCPLSLRYDNYFLKLFSLTFVWDCKGNTIFINYKIIFAIFIAVTAASTPLFPCFPPDLSIACCILLVVKTPNIIGQDSDFKFN